jgi:dihydroxy-acid dehydratase
MTDMEDWKPGQDTQAVATARLLGQDPDKIHCPTWGVIGNLGDSICYAGVPAKVEAIQAELSRRVTGADLPVRVIAPNFAGGISDGQRNGTPEMRYSLIGRETTNDGVCLHLEGSDVRGVIAVVACDKPPVGTLAAILERNVPAVIMSDGSIRPGIDSRTGEPIDIISCFQAAAEPPAERRRIALEASPGHGSCGGMFTYNTMQSFIATCGMEPLHMVSPASEDPRRIAEFPAQLLDALQVLAERDIRPRDIVTPASLRNATLVAIAMGGSTNVVLHAPELARAAGIDFWREAITQDEFNRVSRTLPVLVNARPFGRYSMVDIDAKGGLPVIVRELLDAGLLDGTLPDLHRRDARRAGRPARPARPGRRRHPSAVGAVQANRRPADAARQPGPERRRGDQARRGRGRDGRRPVRRARPRLRQRGGADRGAGVRAGAVRGPRHGGDPLRGSARRSGHAGDARSDLADHRAVPPPRHHHRADDRRPLLGRVGRDLSSATSHPRPRWAARSRSSPTATPSSWTSTTTPWTAQNCRTRPHSRPRQARWQAEAERNDGTHPLVRPADTRLLRRMRACALPPLQGAGLSEAGVGQG